MDGAVPSEFVGDYSQCNDLRPVASRVARQANAGGALRGQIAASNAQANNGNVDRRLYCRFDPTSDACQRANFGVGPQRSVAGYTLKAQQHSFRSVERATEANMRRLDNRQRALCDRMAQEVQAP